MAPAPVDTTVPPGDTRETGGSGGEKQLSKRRHCPVPRVTPGSTFEAPLTVISVMPMALVLNCLLGDGRESLDDAADHAGQ